MQRVTTKHAPRRDDQLAHEEQALLHGSPDEGRTEPRRAEAPGDDEPGMGHRSDPGGESAGRAATTAPESERKAALAACFAPSIFPARRDQLVEEARAHFADDATVDDLGRLPDAIYGSVDDVWDALAAESRPAPGEPTADARETGGGAGVEARGQAR